MSLKLSRSGVSLAALLISSSSFAADLSSLGDAITQGHLSLDMRYRLESVDQEGLVKKATASTLRTRLGYETGKFNGFSGYLEFENIAVLGATSYNNSFNGKTQYPVVADPASTEVNQAYLAYTKGGVTLKGGRQEINLGNQRFIGTVAWRQNEQTFDALSGAYQDGKLSAVAVYVRNVNRVFSDSSPVGHFLTASEAVQVTYKFSPLLEVTGLGLLIDLKTDNPVTNGALSSQTYDIHVAGAATVRQDVKLAYSADYARQSDYATHATNYSAPYYAVEGSATAHNITVRAGYEVMGSDNGVGFQTPLATLHKFDGWADKFLSTPANGLKDLYAGLSATLPGKGLFAGIGVDAVYHDFSSDKNGTAYGKEFDWQITKKINKHFGGALKGAHYHSNGFATNTDKFWISLNASM
jgi:hypothetical protein